MNAQTLISDCASCRQLRLIDTGRFSGVVVDCAVQANPEMPTRAGCPMPEFNEALAYGLACTLRKPRTGILRYEAAI